MNRRKVSFDRQRWCNKLKDVSSIQLFSWLASTEWQGRCNLQSEDWGWCTPLHVLSPPLTPSQLRLETQLSQSRVFPPPLSHSASEISPSSREIASCHPCHNSAVSVLISLHAVDCCRPASTHSCRMRSAVPSPLQCTCYHWNIARTLDRGVFCHNT